MDEPISGEVVTTHEMSKNGEYRKGYIVEEWIDANGEHLARYESGMIRNIDKNIIVKPTDKPFINKDNAHEMTERRKRKTAMKLREEISKKVYGKEITNMPADAIAIVGAQLFEEIAMNPDAPARERINAWLAIGRHAGLISDTRETTVQNTEGVTVSFGVNLARQLVDSYMESKK